MRESRKYQSPLPLREGARGWVGAARVLDNIYPNCVASLLKSDLLSRATSQRSLSPCADLKGASESLPVEVADPPRWRSGRAWAGATNVSRDKYLQCRTTAAFTITEVLVIIAMVGLLIGLLLPALGSARTAARQMQCQANLRQMSIAAQHYTALWDIYPPSIRFESKAGVVHRVAWDWVTTITGRLVEPGPLWKFSDNPDRVMQCPGYRGASNYSGDPYTGYNYNTSYLGAEYVMGPVVNGKVTNLAVHHGAAPHALRSPHHTAVFGLGGFSGGANKYMRAPQHPHGTSPWTTYAGGQAFLYSDQTNIAWADGHVSASGTPHEGMHATPALLRTLRFPQNGFLSNDDSAYDLN